MKAVSYRETHVDHSSHSDSNSEGLLREVIRLNVITTGLALGVLSGLTLFVATFWLVLKGGPQVGKHLTLLVNYFPGYSVTLFGSFVGLIYGFFTGFIAGCVVGWLYNYIVWLRGD